MKPTILVLAAGMGSRYGGLKQMDGLGPNGETIIDYSIYDAVEAGFGKVVYIVREYFKEQMEQVVKEKYSNVKCVDGEPLKFEFVTQELFKIPSQFTLNPEREKPWGTAHAIYCAKDAITEPFLVINADDFYGNDAFKVAADFLNNSKEKEYATIGYEAIKTMTENGSVKRGVIFTKDGQLDSIVESSIIEDGDKIACTPLNGGETFTIEKDAAVSMNMLLFDPTLFAYLDEKIIDFFKKNEDNLEKCEYLIPDVLFDAIEDKYATCKALKTTATWYGVTYREDMDNVKASIKNLVDTNEYPNHLWDE